jgi:hypothetical protein
MLLKHVGKAAVLNFLSICVIETSCSFYNSVSLSFNPDPTTRHTVWSLTIGFFFQWLSIYGVNQSQVQRYISVPNAKTAKK